MLWVNAIFLLLLVANGAFCFGLGGPDNSYYEAFNFFYLVTQVVLMPFASILLIVAI